MGCVALASLMATINLEFLQPFPRVPLHDQAPFQSLFDRISSLQAFLEESSGGGAAAVTAIKDDLEIKISDFALKAEDDIEILLSNFVLAKDGEYREKASQNLHQTVQEAAEIATELLNTIDSISNNESDDKDNGTQPSVHWLKYASPRPRLVARMVGRRRDHIEITNKLIHGDADLQMISIVGMVGIGKTTLAKSVYRDPKVGMCFHVRGWVTMPQEYNRDQILRRLLGSISPSAEKKIEKGSPTTEVAKEVWRQLYEKKYLIVLDNLQVSGKDNWNDIGRCFPTDRYGSRILVTTTHFDRYVYRGLYFYIHNMTLLDADESWDLFVYILPLRLKECMPPEIEKIRSHIVEICDGLPLSIAVVAKRLSKCNDILKEWEKMKKEIESLGILDHNTLTLNYNKLSQNLKVCFLYLGVFPKRKEIPVKKLIGLWIAEGFLEPLEHQELENQGYAYLQMLIDRSLVLICNRSSDWEIKTCRTHSALHSFCVVQAQKVGIFCAVNTLQHLGLPLSEFANSCRWLSLYRHSFDYYVLFSRNNCRSIFFFDEDVETFVPSNLLRVLAFVPSSFLQNLEDLIFLRYLSITQWFEGLNDVLSTNSNLQTLIFSGSESQLEAHTIHLPSTIWMSPQLRHLELGHMYTVDPPSVLKKDLRTLSWAVGPTHCGKEVYFNFPNLKKLKVFYKEDLECSQTDGSSSSSKHIIILDNLEHMKCIERLTIWAPITCTLTLPGPSMFPPQLKKLMLSGTNLSDNDLMIIGKVPRLEHLKLENVFMGREWRVDNHGFRELRFLVLNDKKLKHLVVGAKSFPNLKRLVLRFCYCLEEIPYQFAFSHYLKSIELERCKPSVIDSAKLITKIVQRQWGDDNFELMIDGAKYAELESVELFEGLMESAELDLTSTGGLFTVPPSELFFFLAVYIAGFIVLVLLLEPIPKLFVLPSIWFVLKDYKWILCGISMCLACIGLAITLIS